MKTDPNRPGRPKPLRRTAARSFSLATKQQRFQEVEGRCEACSELIGDGTDWRRAIYHHRRLVSDPNVSDKEARAAANCMVLHPACHDDPVEFTTCTGFFRTISEGSREADSRAAGEARLRFIPPAAPLTYLGLTVLGWGELAAFVSYPVQIARAMALCVLSGVADLLVTSFCATCRNGRRESRKKFSPPN
jgi:hypothetical protein